MPTPPSPIGQLRMPSPCVLVIFGATGDLTKRKLVPALYALAANGFLPDGFSVVGAGRSPMSDDAFRTAMREAVQEYGRLPFSDDVWSTFEQGLRYVAVDVTKDDGLDDLERVLSEIDATRGTSGNRIFYLSIPPSGFAATAERLAKEKLGRQVGRFFRRIVVEKPYGDNLATAQELNAHLHSGFGEDQVYRIDHYLGKETVQNLLVLRFGNGIFEPLWNRRYIDHVQITVAESLGVEDRGSYYEEAGAMRDIVQNHMMQLVAIMGMEPPSTFDAEMVRDEKVKLLRALRPLRAEDALRQTVRGQYTEGQIDGVKVPGYRQEPGVNPESLRETYAAMRVDIDNWRWAGTPFYLRTGKRLPKRTTEIAIQYRHVPHSPFRDRDAPLSPAPETLIDPNLLILRIQPEEGITLRVNAKVPGQALQIRSVNMDFFYGQSFNKPSPDAYERLLLDCMLGDTTLFAREDELEQAWRFCGPILDAWRAHPPDPVQCANYAAGTWGPEDADELMARDRRVWRHI